MSAVDPDAKSKNAAAVVHIVKRGIVRYDEIVSPQQRDGRYLIVNPVGLHIVNNTETNSVVIADGLKITVFLSTEHAVLCAIRVEIFYEVALIGGQQG
jgi:hypothetical protein